MWIIRKHCGDFGLIEMAISTPNPNPTIYRNMKLYDNNGPWSYLIRVDERQVGIVATTVVTTHQEYLVANYNRINLRIRLLKGSCWICDWISGVD